MNDTSFKARNARGPRNPVAAANLRFQWVTSHSHNVSLDVDVDVAACLLIWLKASG